MRKQYQETRFASCFEPDLTGFFDSIQHGNTFLICSAGSMSVPARISPCPIVEESNRNILG